MRACTGCCDNRLGRKSAHIHIDRLLFIDGTIIRLIHAYPTFRTGERTSTENYCRPYGETAAATWAHETKEKYANNANEQKTKDGNPQVIIEPRASSPTPSQYADNH